MKEMQHCTLTNQLAGFLMLVLLAWLTVCLPYVNENRLSLRTEMHLSGDETPDADNDNPLVNTNEEKSESGISLLAEYLQQIFQMEHTMIDKTLLHKRSASALYLAFHPELIIPPPES